MIDLQKIYSNLAHGVSVSMNGPYGYIYYKNDFGFVQFYVELSGVPQYQYLIWFKDVVAWTFPPNREISAEDKAVIKSKLIEFLEQQGITSDIYSQ